MIPPFPEVAPRRGSESGLCRAAEGALRGRPQRPSGLAGSTSLEASRRTHDVRLSFIATEVDAHPVNVDDRLEPRREADPPDPASHPFELRRRMPIAQRKPRHWRLCISRPARLRMRLDPNGHVVGASGRDAVPGATRPTYQAVVDPTCVF